jgi:hypothetical protein
VGNLSPFHGTNNENCVHVLDFRTAPFNIDEMGKMHVTILRSDGEVELIRIHVMMEVATVFIVLNKEEGRWPYRIDNRSSWDIAFSQHVSCAFLTSFHKEL